MAVVWHLEFVVTSESEYCNREHIFTIKTLSKIFTPLGNVVSETLEISRSCILARDGVNTRALCQATGMWHYFWPHILRDKWEIKINFKSYNHKTHILT